MAPLTVAELRDLLASDYADSVIGKILQKRGVDDTVSAREVFKLLYPKRTETKTLLDVTADAYGELSVEEFSRKQEQLTASTWLPLALATVCELICVSKGIKMDSKMFLSAWGLGRLAKAVSHEVSKEERDESFLKGLGL